MITLRWSFRDLRFWGKGDSVEAFSQYNDVYIKRNGNWVCVSANITNISGGKSPLTPLRKVPAPTEFVSIYRYDEKDKETVLQVQQETRKLLANAEYENARNFLDDDFVWLTFTGNLLSKSALLKQTRNNSEKISGNYQVMNLVVRFVASDLAMVHGTMIFDTSSKQKTGIQFNDILVKRERAWIVVSSNDTPVHNL
jgi:hypothetical protein